eukprot:scaffold783_cov313-Chaetoceros_neogracile.AAC.10
MAKVLPSAHEFQSNFHWQYIVHPLHYLTFAVGRKDGTILIDSAENADTLYNDNFIGCTLAR